MKDLTVVNLKNNPTVDKFKRFRLAESLAINYGEWIVTLTGCTESHCAGAKRCRDKCPGTHGYSYKLRFPTLSCAEEYISAAIERDILQGPQDPGGYCLTDPEGSLVNNYDRG